MNKNIIGVGIAIVAILGIVGVVLANQPKKDNTTTPSVSQSTSADTHDMSMQNTTPASSSNGEQDLTAQTEISMDIKDFAFAKKDIKVKKGTKVTWTNQDEAHHNVVSKESGGPKGNLLAQGESYSFTFGTVGTFNYICEPHPYMKGIVNVVE